jgi:cytochrome c-type biogenesis protein CcmF
VVGSVNPTTKRATFRFHVNPLVSWIWVGVVVMMGGAAISLWPEVSFRRLGVWGSIRLATSATAGIMVAVLVASAPARGSASPLHVPLPADSESLSGWDAHSPGHSAPGSVAPGASGNAE